MRVGLRPEEADGRFLKLAILQYELRIKRSSSQRIDANRPEPDRVVWRE
jgi:hypothetical protein